MKNSKEIFSLALGLSSPWSIQTVEFQEKEGRKELHITLCFEKGFKFTGKDKNLYSAHDTVERTWQHLSFFQYRSFIHAKVPRVKEDDGSVTTQNVPWARKGSGFTLLFEAFSMFLIESEMPVSKVAKTLGVYPQRIWNLFHYWISKALKESKIKDISGLGFDETSSKKGHAYVTTAVDLIRRKILYVTKGKDKGCVGKTVEYLKEKSVNIDKIKQVCIDMSPAYISGCAEHLPNASITFDKFHITKEVLGALDELRRKESEEHRSLKGYKYLFLRNTLSENQNDQLYNFVEMYPKLGEGYRLVQMFKDFWDLDNDEEARGYLAYWCDLALESGIQPFIKVVKLIRAHWTGILNYLESRVNNGILEGINSKIQLAKKRARGYRNIDNFINMIYFICGDLKFDYPLYSI